MLREGYSASAPDLSVLVTKLKRAKADVISHAGYNPDITLFLRQARENGLKFKMLFGAGAMLIVAVVLAAFYGPYSRGILTAAGWATARPRNLGVFLGAIVAVPDFPSS